ncbi:MAG: hypothetical protein E7222_14910 [Clostridiales bacterium]|nr:hypothetical protein [Clostridiales bacterium]
MEQQQISLKKQKALEKVKRANADDFSEQELFFGIFYHAGKIRDYNITKKEWVLDGDTVSYGGALTLLHKGTL